MFVRLCYWFARRRLGRVPIPFGIMAYHRTVLASAAAFELTFERAKCVDVKLKELASIKAASLIGCRFCIDIGAAIARGHGIREAQLLALPTYESSPEFSDLERKVLDYTCQMTETPSVPDPALFHALVAELGVPAVVELTASIAHENFRARFNHAVGAKEEGFSDNMVCILVPDARTPTKPELCHVS